jgi:hypothetical protein
VHIQKVAFLLNLPPIQQLIKLHFLQQLRCHKKCLAEIVRLINFSGCPIHKIFFWCEFRQKYFLRFDNFCSKCCSNETISSAEKCYQCDNFRKKYLSSVIISIKILFERHINFLVSPLR